MTICHVSSLNLWSGKWGCWKFHIRLPISSSRVGFLGCISACCWLWLLFPGWETVMFKHSSSHSDLISGTFNHWIWMNNIYLKFQYCSGKLLPPGSEGKPSVTVIWWENTIIVDVSNESPTPFFLPFSFLNWQFCLWCLKTLRRHFNLNSVCYFVDRSCVIRIKHDCSTAPPGWECLLDHIHASWYILLSVQYAISMMTI